LVRKIEDFLKDQEFEANSTKKILAALTDASLAQRVTPEGRSLGFIAWHIVTTLSEMGSHAGLDVAVTKPEDPCPATVQEIAATYEKASQAVRAAVEKVWTDEMLLEEIPMYGEKWPRGVALAALLAHEVHHRGQITVLMRQAGLKVPGVYGPSKEEWEAYGMPAQP